MGDFETMNTSELLVNLTHQGVQLWVLNDKVSICSERGNNTRTIRRTIDAQGRHSCVLHEIDLEALAQCLAEESEVDVSEAEIFEL
jgi:hypothetical protein